MDRDFLLRGLLQALGEATFSFTNSTGIYMPNVLLESAGCIAASDRDRLCSDVRGLLGEASKHEWRVKIRRHKTGSEDGYLLLTILDQSALDNSLN